MSLQLSSKGERVLRRTLHVPGQTAHDSCDGYIIYPYESNGFNNYSYKRMSSVLHGLKKKGLVVSYVGRWFITDEGKEELKRLEKRREEIRRSYEDKKKGKP